MGNELQWTIIVRSLSRISNEYQHFEFQAGGNLPQKDMHLVFIDCHRYAENQSFEVYKPDDLSKWKFLKGSSVPYLLSNFAQHIGVMR
jgi:hypothetical protein